MGTTETIKIPAELIAALHPEHRASLCAGALNMVVPTDVRAMTVHSARHGRVSLCWRLHPEHGWVRDRRAAAARLEDLAQRDAMDTAEVAL